MMGAVCSALLEVGEVVIKSGRVKDFWVYSLPLLPIVAMEELKAI